MVVGGYCDLPELLSHFHDFSNGFVFQMRFPLLSQRPALTRREKLQCQYMLSWPGM